MQKEAEQRVRRMQSRARLIGEDEAAFSPPPNIFPGQKFPPDSFEKNFSVPAFLSGLDNEKIIILALLWILWNDHADPKLLLALLYLLL